VTATRILNPSRQVQAFSTTSNVRSIIPTVGLPLTNAIAAISSLSPSLNSKQTGDQTARPPRPNPKTSRLRNKCRPLLPYVTHGTLKWWWASPTNSCPRCGSCPRPISDLGFSNSPSLTERRSIQLVSQVPRPPVSVSSSASSSFQEFFVAHESQACSPLVPRKGNQEYGTTNHHFSASRFFHFLPSHQLVCMRGV
jgi:hypothetical protein